MGGGHRGRRPIGEDRLANKLVETAEKRIVPRTFIGEDELEIDDFMGITNNVEFTHKPTGLSIKVRAAEDDVRLRVAKKLLENNILNSDKKECVEYVDGLMKIVDRQRSNKRRLKMAKRGRSR